LAYKWLTDQTSKNGEKTLEAIRRAAAGRTNGEEAALEDTGQLKRK
jgi:hypothetical protein